METEVGGVDCPGNVISGNVEYGIWDDGIGTTIAANASASGPHPRIWNFRMGPGQAKMSGK